MPEMGGALVSFARSGTPGADGRLAPPSSSAIGVPRSLSVAGVLKTGGAAGKVGVLEMGGALVSFARSGTPGADGRLAPPSSSAIWVPRSLSVAGVLKTGGAAGRVGVLEMGGALVSFARAGNPGADGRLAPPSSSAIGVPRSPDAWVPNLNSKAVGLVSIAEIHPAARLGESRGSKNCEPLVSASNRAACRAPRASVICKAFKVESAG